MPRSPVLRVAALTPAGIDLPAGRVPLGSPDTHAARLLERGLSAPTEDTGPLQNTGQYGPCPYDVVRALESGGGALRVLFGGDDGEPLRMFLWRLTKAGSSAGVPEVLVPLGGGASYRFGIGTAVSELQEGLAEAVTVQDHEVFGPSFFVETSSGALTGALTSTRADGTVTSVEAGKSCGE